MDEQDKVDLGLEFRNTQRGVEHKEVLNISGCTIPRELYLKDPQEVSAEYGFSEAMFLKAIINIGNQMRAKGTPIYIFEHEQSTGDEVTNSADKRFLLITETALRAFKKGNGNKSYIDTLTFDEEKATTFGQFGGFHGYGRKEKNLGPNKGKAAEKISEKHGFISAGPGGQVVIYDHSHGGTTITVPRSGSKFGIRLKDNA